MLFTGVVSQKHWPNYILFRMIERYHNLKVGFNFIMLNAKNQIPSTMERNYRICAILRGLTVVGKIEVSVLYFRLWAYSTSGSVSIPMATIYVPARV